MAENDIPPDLRNSRRRALPIVAGLLLVVGGVGYWMWQASGRESTDDAQIDGRITQIAAEVTGPIEAIHVVDNQHVDAGTLLLELERPSFEIAVERARAELAAAEATAKAAQAGLPVASQTVESGAQTARARVQLAQSGITVSERELEAVQARVRVAEARQRDSQAESEQVRRDLERLKELIERDEISQQRFDRAVRSAESADASLEAAVATVAENRADVTAAESRLMQARSLTEQAESDLEVAGTGPEQVEVTRAQASAADARVLQAKATLRQAEINLANTSIRAPTSGVVSRKSVQVGQLVARGQPLLALVSLDDLWVVANFKETQLEHVEPGQPAVIEVDGLGGRAFRGRVESIAAATSAKFSLLPAGNATGNYVKVVQRIPVKLVFDAGQDPQHQLKPGMSVVPTIEIVAR
jgi:membrane fusion protein, multidrug efflux system